MGKPIKEPIVKPEPVKPIKEPIVKPEPEPPVAGVCPCGELEITGLEGKFDKFNGMCKEEKEKYSFTMGMFVSAKGLCVIGDVNEKDGEVRFMSEQAAAVRCPRDLVNREGSGWKAANEIQQGIMLMCIKKCPMCKEVFDGPYKGLF